VDTVAPPVETFIAKWEGCSGSERANFQTFLVELCAVIGVPTPGPNDDYRFERPVERRRLEGADTANYIDLYRRGCFVMEAKQSRKRVQAIADARQLSFDAVNKSATEPSVSAGWDTMMKNARAQAEGYAKSLPAAEGWPPFLIIVDVGRVIELFSDFSLQGKHYAQFPDRREFRVSIADLRDAAVRERLRAVWMDPSSLDPAQRAAEVTRDIAEILARLSASLESRLQRRLPPNLAHEETIAEKHAIAEKVALFLMRCLFTMFAEDVRLLKKDCFTNLLKEYQGQAGNLHQTLRLIWQQMNSGGFSPILANTLLRFNGMLFKDPSALELNEEDLALLITAASRDWRHVEPAIFGTLLERALDPRERHRLGAHYTPRAYVERLVVDTVIEPLTQDWRDVQAAAAQLMEASDDKAARKEVLAFHRRLCATRVLDPACGTGNFLYVTMELMKRLEGEVLETLYELGETQHTLDLDRHTVSPNQFLGLEINPRAVAIAELVLWIGYLQWHFRTRGDAMPSQPVLRDFHNIREQDAIVAYNRWDVLRDANGRPITRWDGVTYTAHPITGEAVPDDAARVEMRSYVNPRPASWPETDFIVGNPPFIGGKDMRQELGDGYAEACWAARPYVPGGADFVMHFWDKAAETVRLGRARRFGLITTNSLSQKFSRRVVERHLNDRTSLSLAVAVPDHPWLKAPGKAAVRIAMTVGVKGDGDGVVRTVLRESNLNTDAPKVELSERRGRIAADLTVGPAVAAAVPLKANAGVCSPGVKLHGSGFIVTPKQAAGLGLGKVPGLEKHILPYRNGRDLASRPRGVLVIDLYPLTEAEVRDRFAAVYQWILDRVKPERDHNNRKSYREQWWIFGEPRSELRSALLGLDRYIATVETSKHRFFQFLDANIRPDNMLVNIGSDDAFVLGVLSSRVHVAWALAAGGRQGVGNDPRYNKTRCFDCFPVPNCRPADQQRVRDHAERLERHRAAVLDRHRHLTMTGLYNVLEKVRAGGALSAAERDVYDAGLVGVMRQHHDALDDAVAEAYGWPAELSTEDLLARLVALNRERAAEERRGVVRWLRPEFQAPERVLAAAEQLDAELPVAAAAVRPSRLPKALPEQVAAIRAHLAATGEPVRAPEIARRFAGGRRAERRIEEVLRTLALLGQAERAGDGYILPS
jgi:SAM-dependent methyltransferase